MQNITLYKNSVNFVNFLILFFN